MSIFMGVNGVNREIKSLYSSVGGINREVKSVFNSVGGVNREVYKNRKYLFKDGNQCTELTGGWTDKNLIYVGYGSGTLLIENNLMKFINIFGNKGFCTKSYIEFSGYKKISIELNTNLLTTDGTSKILVALNKVYNTDVNKINYIGQIYTTTPRKIFEFDVSSFSGQYSVIVSGYTNSTSYLVNANMYNLWLSY